MKLKAYQVKIKGSSPGCQTRMSTGIVFDKNSKEAGEQAEKKMQDSYKTSNGSKVTISVVSVKPIPSAFILTREN